MRIFLYFYVGICIFIGPEKQSSIKTKEAMKTYYDLENALFEEWELEANHNHEVGDFVRDGLLYRGAIYYEDGYWKRNSGNESQQWDKASKRLLILTKDMPYEAWDIRMETGRKSHTGEDHIQTEQKFYPNLMTWSYGLLTMAVSGKIIPFEQVSNLEDIRTFYEQAPIARVNCKKQVGESEISTATLNDYVKRYAKWLLRQITLYDADIILCCDASGHIPKSFVQDEYLTDLERINDWIYYSMKAGKVVIDSYHPSCRINREETYKDMMAGFGEFLQKYPDFVHSSR